MSLLTLLVDFPNYSARKVRRLAKQIAMVQGLQKVADVGEETGILKGIESDLMEYNLHQARVESQLNDDVANPTPVTEKQVIESIHVCPTTAARRAVEEVMAYMRDNLAVTEPRIEALQHLQQKVNGIINGQSFYTDRSFIQAKLSPQGDLPLDHAQSGEPA